VTSKDFFYPLINKGSSDCTIALRKSRSRNGHLVWLAGLSLQVVAIEASYFNLKLAWIIVLIGIVLSGLSFMVDREIVLLNRSH
jgi:hypothetical protein